jgi:hypothetical protein
MRIVQVTLRNSTPGLSYSQRSELAIGEKADIAVIDTTQGWRK